MRPPRFVIVADVRGMVARLTVAANGSGRTTSDVASLARAAALEPRIARGAVLLPLRQLPDLEALCEWSGVIVQRRQR